MKFGFLRSSRLVYIFVTIGSRNHGYLAKIIRRRLTRFMITEEIIHSFISHRFLAKQRANGKVFNLNFSKASIEY